MLEEVQKKEIDDAKEGLNVITEDEEMTKLMIHIEWSIKLQKKFKCKDCCETLKQEKALNLM